MPGNELARIRGISRKASDCAPPMTERESLGVDLSERQRSCPKKYVMPAHGRFTPCAGMDTSCPSGAKRREGQLLDILELSSRTRTRK